MADLGDPIRVIEIQPIEAPVPSEMPIFEPEREREDVPVEVER